MSEVVNRQIRLVVLVQLEEESLYFWYWSSWKKKFTGAESNKKEVISSKTTKFFSCMFAG